MMNHEYILFTFDHLYYINCRVGLLFMSFTVHIFGMTPARIGFLSSV